MFTKASSAAAQKAERDRLLAKAAEERREREKAAANRSQAVTCSRFLRGCAVRRKQARDLIQSVGGKANDLEKVGTIFAAKGVPFVPPATALLPLVRQLVLSHGILPTDFSLHYGTVIGLAKWVHRSLLTGPALLVERPWVMKQTTKLFVDCLLSSAVPAANKVLLLDCIALACGLPALSTVPDSVALQAIRRTAWAELPIAVQGQAQTQNSAASTAAGIHAYVHSSLRFAERVARPLCFAVRSGDTTSSKAATAVSTDAQAAAAAVELSMVLAQTALVGPSGQGSSLLFTVQQVSHVIGCLLSVPWLIQRLAGTRVVSSLAGPALLDTIIACTVAQPPVLVHPGQHSSLKPAQPWKTPSTRASAVSISSGGGGGGVGPDAAAAGGAQSMAGGAGATAASSPAPSSFMPTQRIATIFESSSGPAGGITASFFQSDAAKASLADSKTRDATREERKQMEAWPPEAYLLGNLLQLLADAVPAVASNVAGGSASPVGTPTSPGAAVVDTADYDASGTTAWVGPVLAGTSWPAIAYLGPASAARAVGLISDLMACVPGDVWGVTTPVTWVRAEAVVAQASGSAGAGPAAGAANDTSSNKTVPVPMPSQLISQLRRLSSERLAKATAGLLIQPHLGAIRHQRLRLPPSEDPEKASYSDADLDAYGVDAVAGGRLGRDAAAGGSSNLASAATGLAAIARAAWQTSKLALSLFGRRKDNGQASINAESKPLLGSSGGGGSGAGAASGPGGFGGGFGDLPLESGPSFEDEHVLAFCRLYAELLAPRTAAVRGSSGLAAVSGAGLAGVGDDPIVNRNFLLRSLAFHPSLALPHALWLFMADRLDTGRWLREAGYKCACTAGGAWAVVTVFAAVLGHATLVVDDFELYEGLAMGSTSSASASAGSSGAAGGIWGGDGSASPAAGGVVSRRPVLPLLPPLRELRHAVRLLRDVLAHAEGIGVDALYTPAAVEALPAPPSLFWPRFSTMAASVLRLLYERHCQRPLGPPSMWQLDPDRVALTIVPSPDEAAEGLRDKQVAIRRLLSRMPFAVPFAARVQLYDQVREADRRANQEGQPQVKVAVQRSRLFETAYAALREVRGPLLKRKLFVTFVNEAGTPESGIDAGGLFKELWTELARVVFHPGYGLWSTTEQGDLYPNPASAMCTGLNDDDAFTFLGRVTGKALYEGITVGPRWARFWLAQLLGRAPNLHDLPSLDPELYRSLMFLRTCAPADVPELYLTFTITPALGGSGGSNEETELTPGGRDMPVTAANRLQYIHLVAHHRLRASIARQTDAFLRGLHEVLPAAWLGSFSPPELQVLASGSTGGIDVQDLQANTTYTGGYSGYDRVIKDFWSVVDSLPQKDRAALLRFCTSCERPPPLGFRQLEPKFTIARVAIRRDDEALPSSSTCFHVLKLPNYSSKATVRDKLLLAIHSGAGFELT